MRPSLLLCLALPVLVGCGPVITLHHRSAPDAACNADPGSGAGPGIFDVLFGRGYVALIAASSPVGVTLESAVVYAEQDGEPVTGLPNEQSSRYSTVGGFVQGEPRVVPVRLLTQQEATVIRDGFIGSTLQSDEDRASINVSTVLAGGAYSSNQLTLELQLCRGCLVPVCNPGQAYAGACFLGQDERATCVDD